jgi:hypothetical protein
MPSLILEVGILAAFGITNSPWPKNDFQTPYLYMEKSVYEEFYVSALNSARTNAKKIDCMNPKTALWQVEGGWKRDGFTVAIGHSSEHEVGSADKLTESNNFIKVSYRMEYY